MKKIQFILFYFLLFCVSGFSQNNPNGFNVWKLTSLSGEVKTKGFYREYEIVRNDFSDEQKSSYLIGGVLINTKSFFLHPNFLLVDVDAGYYPETSRNNYIVVPDQAEVRTSKKLDIRSTLFNQKKITLITFAGFNETYQNREYITDVKSNSKQWGGTLFYSNKFLPFSAGFRQSQWKQEEIATARKVSMDERVFEVKTNKSFIARDNHELNYLHKESINQNVFTNQDVNLFSVKNIIDDTHLNSRIPLDEKRKHLFNSTISNFNQRGNMNYNRFQALESITIKLPENFTLFNNYNLNLTRQELYKMIGQSIQSSLSHKFYQSLNSRVFFEYSQTNHTAYREYSNKTGIDLQYIKKIPAGGRLSLSYTYFIRHQNIDSDPSNLQIANEEYILSDGQIVLFKRAYINKESVVVRDVTGAIIYQLNLDYLLIDKDPYLEIVRVPGGLIANNAAVYIDYTATQPGSYKYDTDNHTFTADVLLFNRKLEVYYRFSEQDYKNMSKTEYQTLNYYSRNVVGCRLDFGFINGGAEYDVYKSTIIPYRMLRYFISIQKNYREKLLLTLNGNLQDYYMVNENIHQKYADVTAKIAYTIFRQTRIDANLMYRKQSIRGIDLDLFTARSEITSVVRQLYFTFGAEIYKYLYVSDKVNFKGVYISITRKF